MTSNLVPKKHPNRFKREAFDIYDGEVKIYRTTSKTWQFQMWISEEKRYVRKTLDTENREDAIVNAKKKYIYYQAKIQNNEKIFSITAHELRVSFLVYIQNQVENKQLSIGRAANIKTSTNHYLDFVGKNSNVQNIDPKKFREYLAFRRSEKLNITFTVIRNESITIKQLYTFGISEGYLNQVYMPDFGVIKVPKDEVVREAYTTKEYNQLINFSKNWYKAKDTSNDEEKYYRRLINDFIILMANGGFRTQELRLLKWKDIKNITPINKEKEVFVELVIRAENTKVKKNRRFEMRRGDVFNRIKSYSNHTEPEDYVFSAYTKNTVLDKRHLYSYFKKLILLVKSKHPTFDETKTIYCLRHFWITIRILAGLNVYD
nr:site-specific integrase [Nitrosomonas sp.]